MTTANKITVGRILLVPFFVTQLIYYVADGLEFYRLTATLAFAAAAISDGLDGFIARRYKQRSELGAVLDPVADKLLLVSAIILLSLNNDPFFDRLPAWLAVTIISRDVILFIGIGIIYYFCGRVKMAPRMASKAATVLQMAAVLWVLLKLDPQWLYAVCAATAITTGIAGIQYIFDGMRQLSASPSSGAQSRS